MDKDQEFKKILCVRLDNIGDIIMSGPAFRALKESFNCHITLLTSTAASAMAEYLPGIDEVLTYNAPWVKEDEADDETGFMLTVAQLKNGQFDAAIIFTVFSQSPLPAAMMVFLAGIPVRVAYCRENPYQLLTHWIPEREPQMHLQHQVKRDLCLVKEIGAYTVDERLQLKTPVPAIHVWKEYLRNTDPEHAVDWVLLHPGVSEEKRRFNTNEWIEAGKLLCEAGFQILVTGSAKEWSYAEVISKGIGNKAVNVAGSLSAGSFIELIGEARLIITVNTSASHIAAATGTPVVVLYALSNPQHLPWKAKGRVLLFDIPVELRSRNPILRHVQDQMHAVDSPVLTAKQIFNAAMEVLKNGGDDIPELVGCD